MKRISRAYVVKRWPLWQSFYLISPGTIRDLIWLAQSCIVLPIPAGYCSATICEVRCVQKPLKLRHMLSQYGEIGRLYLAPEGKAPLPPICCPLWMALIEHLSEPCSLCLPMTGGSANSMSKFVMGPRHGRHPILLVSFKIWYNPMQIPVYVSVERSWKEILAKCSQKGGSNLLIKERLSR